MTYQIFINSFKINSIIIFWTKMPATLFIPLLFSILAFSNGFGHFESQDVANTIQCFSRCVAKCLADHSEIGLNECQANCRQYGQHNLCANNFECWKRCKDLGFPIPEGGPPRPPPHPPREVQANINENFTIDIKWQPGPGPEGEKSSLFLIEVQAESPNLQTTQILAQGLKYSNFSPSSPDNICGPLTVRVAAINAAKGVGHFSKEVQIPAKAPQISAKMELISIKYNATPFVMDDYESNGTLNLELEFKYNGWPFGIDDLEVNPIFHLVSCTEPDLNMATPFPDFFRGTKPNRIMTNLGADMMFRKCNFVYAVEQIHSIKCGREYSIVAGKNDFGSIDIQCKNVEGAELVEYCADKIGINQNGPVCGFHFTHFNYTIDEEKIEPKTKEKTVSVSLTFEPMGRIKVREPKYYVAIYGNAEKRSRNGIMADMVNVTKVIGQQTSCAEFSDDGCKRFNGNSKNLITLHGLKMHTEYGVVLCAIMDPKNLSLPDVVSADKSIKPYAYPLFMHRNGYIGGDSYESGEEEGEEKENGKGKKMEKRNIVPYLVIGIIVLLAMFLVAILTIFCWIRRQKDQIKKKRLNLEAMQRGREQRYTDFPSRREDPWELERKNLIIYEDKKLGAGAFGSVYLGKLVGINRLKNDGNNLNIGLLRAENALVAVKMLPEYADDLSKSEFLREIGLMKTLGYHERLVNMLACVTQSEPYCLVVEYCSDGDLLQFLRHRCKYMLELDDAGVPYSDPECDAEFDRSMIMTVKQLLMFSVQISYGLEYLSQKGFVHRDVAARNVLVHEKTHAKIGDFGLCRFIYADSSNYKGRGGRLPIKWMSPEAIRHYEFTTSSDVWSFGVLMFEIITLGGTPYPGIQPDDMLAFLESGNRIAQPDNCPNEYYKVMCSCWTADHRMRPDFGAIRQQLALQLENVSDEYAYLKLDAKKDYYNVSYGELKAQRGEEIENNDGNGEEENDEQKIAEKLETERNREEESQMERAETGNEIAK